MTEQNKWSGQLTRQDSIKIIASATNHDDPYWENLVDKHYDETSDTMPSIFHVFAALGITVDEYKEATGAQNVDWPEQNKQPPAEAGAAVAWLVTGIETDGTVLIRVPFVKEDEARALAQAAISKGGYCASNVTIHPLYTSQTTATQAAVAAAMRKCAGIANAWVDVPKQSGQRAKFFHEIRDEILASTPAEATAALEKICMEVALDVRALGLEKDGTIHSRDLRAIVTSVIEKRK